MEKTVNRARASACRNCRVRKRRCLPSTSSHGDESCQLCIQQGIQCSLVHIAGSGRAGSVLPNRPIIPGNNPLASPSGGDFPVSNSSNDQLKQLPPPPILHELVELYFRLIHDGPHTLFHEPTFFSRLARDEVPKFLLFAVISLSSRFSTTKYFQNDPRSYAIAYAANSIELLQKEMIRPTLETIQAYIIISQHLGGEGDVRAKHICTGLARLHSQSLCLWETSDMTLLEQQLRRRTYLSVVITGKWSTADMSIAPALSEYPAENLVLLDEEDFLALRESPPHHGMWAQMARTIDLYRNILDIIILLSSGEILTSQIEKVNELAHRLDSWEKELPERLKYNSENLAYFERNAFLKTFLAMHIGYHHYRQLLFYPFLDPRNENRLASECKKHAIMVSKIAAHGGQLVYYIIGHILVVSSSIHLHTLMLGGGDVDLARQYLLSNFDILMKLKRHWPVVDAAVNKLRSFQSHCSKSSLDSFVLDDWMWKFLISQSAVLGENRETRSTTQRSPFVSNTEMDNTVLVESALSWLLDS